jgi:protein FAM32A
MPSSDYAAASGGALKLKGANISKKKKIKKKPSSTEPSTFTSEAPTGTSSSTALAKGSPESTKESSATPLRSISPDEAEREIKAAGGRQKTEAEKRYEEMRRKRLEERLKKEGVKTHKEKVEGLNKYLSGLSEHHDMPKIGPG